MKDLWQFIPLGSYERLSEPKSEIARKGAKAFMDWLRRRKPAGVSVDIHAELRSIPQQMLDTVAPPPDWEDKTVALHDAVLPWINAEKPEYTSQVIIGAPGSGTRQTMEQLSLSHKWEFIEPPSPAEILTGGKEWLSVIKDSENTVVVIPELERCFIRHTDGLTLVRDFLDFVWERNQRYIIGCNSWAWSYLSRVLSIDSQFRNPLILRPFDGQRLEHWFRSMAQTTCKHTLIFRQSDNGEAILTVNQADGNKKEKSETYRDKESSDLLKIIAARSNGIPLVAWAIWRNCLQISADAIIEDEAQRAAKMDQGLTIWVRPWAQTELPAIPHEISKTDVFVLHAVLLHGGIHEDVLPMMLSIQQSTAVKSLQRLLQAGLIKEENGLWRTTLSGYPAVKKYLAAEDYLTDML